ncbi:MAG: efflux RND transporter periplasmic adaptor subunit [Gammaproteobacteria bacterium]
MFTYYLQNNQLPQRLRVLGVVLATTLGVLILNGCSEPDPAKKPKARDQTVAVVSVERGPLTIHRQSTGSLEPISRVHIINEAQGRITQLPFYPGDRVRQGQLLVQLDDAVARAELDKAIASYNQARLDLKRLERLMPRKLASEDEIARAQTAVELANAEASLRRTQLAHTRIDAPFDGIISERFKEPGDVVSLHGHILTLIDDSALKARISVSEYLLSELRNDLPVAVVIDALGEQAFAGKILRVYPAVDPASRLGTAEVLLSPVPPNARAGQLCRVTLDIHTAPLLSLPFSAIKHDSRGDYVFTVDAEGKARYTAITTGLQAGSRIQVIEGLESGARVITRGHIGLNDGKAVKISADGTTARPAAANPATDGERR